jgi:hypothetical protein
MRRSLCLAVLILTVCAPSVLRAGDPGTAGALFLRIGMGARASGMGEAFIGVAEDASAVYWNPAAMGAVLGTRLMFTHDEYLQSMRLEQVALTHETEYGTLGLGFTGLYMDEMDRYEDTPSAVPLGKFSAYDVSFSLAFARYVVPNLAVGVAVKPVYEKIDQETASGLAFDIGLYHVSRIPGVKLAAVAANVGSPMKFVSQKFALPRTLKIGASYERHITQIKGDILATLDVVGPNDGDLREHLGAEYGYDRRLFLRAGYKAGYDTHGATFGLGLRLHQFDFDYGVLLGGNDLGDSHRISLSLRV